MFKVHSYYYSWTFKDAEQQILLLNNRSDVSRGRIKWKLQGHCWGRGQKNLWEDQKAWVAGQLFQASPGKASHLPQPPSCVMRRLENETFSSKICSYDCLWCILRFVCGLQRLPDSDKKNVPFPTLSPSQLPHLTRSPSEQLSWSFVQNPAAVQSWLQVYQAVFCVLFPRWHWRCCPVFPRTHPECCSLATKRPSHHLYKLPLPEVQGLLNASG